MAVGIQYAVTDVNNNVGQLAHQLKITLDELHAMRLWYLALGAGGLTNAAYSMTSGDDATIGSALADAEQLYQLFHDNGTLADRERFHGIPGEAVGLWILK